ncbi:hypothetical protein ACVH9Z_39090 [Rhodococcus opacus]
MTRRSEQVDLLVTHIKTVGLEPKHRDAHYSHIGALLTDAGLQGNTNYSTNVVPKALKVQREWPDAATISGFQARLAQNNFGEWIPFRGKKPVIIEAMADALGEMGVETVGDLLHCYTDAERELDLIFQLDPVKGVGPKTINYLAILAGSPDHVAIDGQLTTFAQEAGVSTRSERFLGTFYRSAAKQLGCTAASLDAAVWTYMSTRKRTAARQP